MALTGCCYPPSVLASIQTNTGKAQTVGVDDQQLCGKPIQLQKPFASPVCRGLRPRWSHMAARSGIRSQVCLCAVKTYKRNLAFSGTALGRGGGATSLMTTAPAGTEHNASSHNTRAGRMLPDNNTHKRGKTRHQLSNPQDDCHSPRLRVRGMHVSLPVVPTSLFCEEGMCQGSRG